MKSSLNGEVLLSTQNYLLGAFLTLPNCLINYLHTSIDYMISLYFFMIFHVFVISFCIWINRVTYQKQLKDLILLYYFLKLLAMLIWELKEILQDQAHIFQDTYLESSQIHQLTIMYRFEHTNHDILLNSLFQNLHKLFLCTHNLHQ